MLRHLLTLAVAATLLAPLTSFAEDAPVVPVTPAAPTAPAAPVAPKKHDHIGGKISAVDSAAKTITLTHHKKDTVVTLASDAKIYKIGDAKGEPTGTFADLTVGALVNAHITGDVAAPTATEVHLRAPKIVAPVAPATP